MKLLQRFLPFYILCSLLLPSALNALECVKTFTQKHKRYPDRFPVPEDKRLWEVSYPEYNPPAPEFEELAKFPWREPDLPSLENAPRNPCGRTGIGKRGILGKWGPNQAADVLVTRYSPVSGKLLVLLQLRADTQEWAMPGGMVDKGETPRAAARRELREETGLYLPMEDAKETYNGYVDDSRNTDNAWMTTVVFHKHLDNQASQEVEGKKLAPEDPTEVKDIQWIPYDDPRLNKLFASHSTFVNEALKPLTKQIKIRGRSEITTKGWVQEQSQ